MNFKKFLFYCPQALLAETRSIAGENSISTSAFIRESLARNIRAHRVTENAMIEMNTLSATIRSK